LQNQFYDSYNYFYQICNIKTAKFIKLYKQKTNNPAYKKRCLKLIFYQQSTILTTVDN